MIPDPALWKYAIEIERQFGIDVFRLRTLVTYGLIRKMPSRDSSGRNRPVYSVHDVERHLKDGIGNPAVWLHSRAIMKRLGISHHTLPRLAERGLVRTMPMPAREGSKKRTVYYSVEDLKRYVSKRLRGRAKVMA